MNEHTLCDVISSMARAAMPSSVRCWVSVLFKAHAQWSPQNPRPWLYPTYLVVRVVVSTQHAVQSTQYTVQSTQYTVHTCSTPHTGHSTLHLSLHHCLSRGSSLLSSSSPPLRRTLRPPSTTGECQSCAGGPRGTSCRSPSCCSRAS